MATDSLGLNDWNSYKCTDPGFHFRGRLPPQTGASTGLRCPASAESRSYQGESSSLSFRLSPHYRPVEPKNICQCNDRYNKIEKNQSQLNFGGLNINLISYNSSIPDYSNSNGFETLHGSHHHLHFGQLLNIIQLLLIIRRSICNLICFRILKDSSFVAGRRGTRQTVTYPGVDCKYFSSPIASNYNWLQLNKWCRQGWCHWPTSCHPIRVWELDNPRRGHATGSPAPIRCRAYCEQLHPILRSGHRHLLTFSTRMKRTRSRWPPQSTRNSSPMAIWPFTSTPGQSTVRRTITNLLSKNFFHGYIKWHCIESWFLKLKFENAEILFREFEQNHEFTYDVNLGDVKSAIRSRSLDGWVIRVTTVLHSYFVGEARDGFIETRVIHAQLKFKFSGAKTAVFKPGMPFEGHVYVMYVRRRPGPDVWQTGRSYDHAQTGRHFYKWTDEDTVGD